jgi:putative ABC transport system ATP-binding protein
MEEEFIVVEGLTKSYMEGGQERSVLRDAFAQISCGEIVAVLGKSGSGKSTLLNLISGIDRADRGLTVFENVTLPGELSGIPVRETRQRAEKLLEAVGLQDRLNTFPDRLSGGEQQRVAIARALINDPQLLLADEPTGNLDEETGTQVLALLDRLTRQAGKNMIMVTHSNDAVAYADRVLLLRDGKLEEVVANPVQLE